MTVVSANAGVAIVTICVMMMFTALMRELPLIINSEVSDQMMNNTNKISLYSSTRVKNETI